MGPCQGGDPISSSSRGADEQALEALEFPEILDMLRAETVTPRGASLAPALRPSGDPGAVRRETELTAEAARYLRERGALPFGTVPDAGASLERLGVEASLLPPLQVLDLLSLMRSGRDLKAALRAAREEFPRLWELGRDLPDLGNLLRFLDGRIGSSGEFEDQASDELRSIRQDLRRRTERLGALLEEITSRPEVLRALQDDFVSIRSERHVIPIRAAARSALQGIVHGVSGSGATVFMEPLETVDLNNEIVTLRERESAEIRRLLQEYSTLLRGRLPELRSLWEVVGRLDLAMARARLARVMRARAAELSASGELMLRQARHPLVETSLRSAGREIVPLDLRLPARTRVLILSGPNTGGKTVALKTVGLLAAMHQSGLMVPAEAALLPVYSGIFIDIGDRQSIADQLSTFSARIRTAAAIASALSPPALVLLDEVGTGTDPDEGVALGAAIVDHYRQRGATVIATTHLEAIKAYAAATEGCANAAMEFDETTFAPTYRLVPGIPGRSGALEIAGRLGLPQPILESARARRGSSAEMVETYLARLQGMSAELDSRLRHAAEERDRLRVERERFGAEMRDREERQRQAIAAEIELALRSMREEGERYLATLREREVAIRMRLQEERAARRMRSAARDLIRRVGGAAARSTAPAASEVKAGAWIRVEGMGVSGTVEAVHGRRVVVLVRGKRVTAARADCRPLPGGPGSPPDRGARGPRRVSFERARR
ncbi:MAG: hypothetical protein ACE5JH_11780, partial [Acidobacteriota bacterium]